MYSSDEVLQILKTLNRATSETYIMLENLLEWSNLEVGALDFELKPIDVSELIEDATTVLATMIERKGIDLQVTVPDGVTICADELMLGSVLRNLTSNAIKFTHDGGQVCLRVQADEAGLVFEIIDSGIGMAPDQVEAVCAAQSVKSVVGTDGERGSGVGFMLIHQFLAKHGSKLELSSVVGSGTTACFTLPFTNC